MIDGGLFFVNKSILSWVDVLSSVPHTTYTALYGDWRSHFAIV